MASITYYGYIDYNKDINYAVLIKGSSDNIGLSIYNNTKGWDGTLEYSLDYATWNTWTGAAQISSNTGEIYLRGSNNTVITGEALHWFVITGDNIVISGNIECLLDYQTVKNGNHITNLGGWAFQRLFYYNRNIIDASKLKLPIASANAIYMELFRECTALVKAPELPATTVANSGYYCMFLNCSSLEAPPALPATTIGVVAYERMFYGCTSLNKLPALPATVLPPLGGGHGCYYWMFLGCSKIKLSTTQVDEYQTPYRIPTTGTGEGYLGQDMFRGTGGTFTGTPDINTTYYTANEVIE